MCSYWTTQPTVRVCMSGTQVLQFAAKLVGVSRDKAVTQVIAWAQAHVPTVAELPSKPWAYWDAQWDSRPTARKSEVPDSDATQQMIAAAEARART